MNLLTRQNIFQVRKSPDMKRKNYLVQTAATSRPQSKDIGISNSRHHSIQFDRLYNPYRLMELGASQHSSTQYKSMDTKKYIKLSLVNLKTVTLGNNIDRNKIQAVEKEQNIFKQYFQKSQISEICPCIEQKSFSQMKTLKSSRQFLEVGQMTQEMFGNMSKITSEQTSFLSFASQNGNPTVFYSIISNSQV